MEYYSAVKEYEIMPFAATWRDLGIIILSEINQRRKNIIGHSLYVESKYGTDEPIYKTETDSQA